jgi:type I restriction enzyme, S subunit
VSGSVVPAPGVSWYRYGFRSEENKVVHYQGLCDPAICIHSGDLLMTRANTSQLVGRSCIVGDVPAGLMLSDKILRLKVAERQVSTRYVHIVLGLAEIRRQIEIAATGTSNSMKNISQNSIRQLIVPLGSQEDVNRVVAIDTLHEARMTALRDEIEGLRLLKRGLTDDLLTGRVRVPVL